MKNIVKVIMCVAMALLMVWGVWSWWDVVSSNTPTSNREISKYNFFVLLTKEEDNTQMMDATRAQPARIDHTTNNSVVFCTLYDGELWRLVVNNPEDWSKEAHYNVVFDTQGTEDKLDDHILRVRKLANLLTVE